MNPHRLAWGFAQTMPFAMVVALTTFVGMLMSREPRKLQWKPEMVLMLVFLAWMLVTTSSALYPILAWPQFDKVMKIFIMIFVTTMLINTRERLLAMVWVIALSIGYYGVKGGIFTLTTGGGFRVQGPLGTFIGGNNEIGLALCMTIPLLYYLGQQAKRIAIRNAMLGAVLLTVVAALGTQSRGALLGLAVTGTIFWLKSRRKIQIGLLIAFAILVIVPFMPETWSARMQTIENYQQDTSAMSRIAAWKMAINLASNRLTGGGFESFQAATFRQYAPEEKLGADAHSIYFEVLGEHGWPGLAIFLVLIAFTWFSASQVRRKCKKLPDLRWLGDLMAMTQVSLAAYLATGAFLGMAYFDYFYNLVVIVVMAKVIFKQATAVAPSVSPQVERGPDTPRTPDRPAGARLLDVGRIA
jgi:probable O-glycosylation ligase (exosortase A-associated)